MRLSTKGQYGVRAMLELALNYGEGPIALKTIAEKQDISEHYLEQLIAILKKAGLVKSTRGAQGGYTLAMAPSEITVGDILRALEGPLAPVECVIDGEEVECQRADFCVSRLVWQKIKDSLNKVVDSITLQDMVDDYKKMNSKDSYMYYI
ncbi:transcriptional regulator, BadM/Rrf2 family [Caldanaerobius fijiensis DSM 17918]|uniref:Transcriptional regulator, BadM/Rrf2 family n=1 Tax=Caldanaerobius fijiensis DSM 17918 TaxID=1121256 RepID=A0A1M4U0Q9_9THEO|nr:Rrf2 family transcriptional regulator [Caldanaerobius fijiensis]SHE50187.1 transcriptional regulator, BadM/Rrf2 family [Caldanaerobius fijiensis DSM 17918]